MPLLTFLDSSGAYPGLEDEQRGQAWALADNIAALTELRVRIIASVIGEGAAGLAGHRRRRPPADAGAQRLLRRHPRGASSIVEGQRHAPRR